MANALRNGNFDTSGMPTTPSRPDPKFDAAWNRAWGQSGGNVTQLQPNNGFNPRDIEPAGADGVIDDLGDPGLRSAGVRVTGGRDGLLPGPELDAGGFDQADFGGFGHLGGMVDGDAPVPWSPEELRGAFAGEQPAQQAPATGGNLQVPNGFQGQNQGLGNQVQGNIRQIVHPPAQSAAPPATAQSLTLPPGMSLQDYTRAIRFKDHLESIDQNPQLRQHVNQFYLGGAQQNQQPQQPPPDELADLAPEDREVLQRHESRIMRGVQQMVQQAVQPFQQQQEQMNAMREEQEFVAAHPNWNQHVHADELRQAKEMKPDLPLTALYRILAFDRAGQAAPAPQHRAPIVQEQSPAPQATREPSAHQQVIQRLMNRTRPANVPRTESPTVKVPAGFGDSFDFAMELLRSGRGI